MFIFYRRTKDEIADLPYKLVDIIKIIFKLHLITKSQASCLIFQDLGFQKDIYCCRPPSELICLLLVNCVYRE